jgi:hypothetical protein
MAMITKSKLYDIFVILLIILYTILIFVYFGVDGTDVEKKKNLMKMFYIIEIVILSLFVIDITIHITAYFCMYLRDPWNIFDLIVIILSIVFVILDFKIKN